MGKNLLASYTALGVGLAIVLTLGLSAISSVMEKPSESQFTASEPESMKTVPTAPVPDAPVPPETQEDVRAREGAYYGAGSASPREEVIEEAPASQEEMAKESYSIAAEVPASPFAGLLVALPYIAAGVVASAVFVVTRKRFRS